MRNLFISLEICIFITGNQYIMSVFRDHKVSASELLDVIPEELLSNLSQTTKDDYYTKILHDKKLFSPSDVWYFRK